MFVTVVERDGPHGPGVSMTRRGRGASGTTASRPRESAVKGRDIRLAAACLITTAALPGCDKDGGEGAETSAAAVVAVANEAVAPEQPPDPAMEARARTLMENRLAEIAAAIHLGTPRSDAARSIRIVSWAGEVHPGHLDATEADG